MRLHENNRVFYPRNNTARGLQRECLYIVLQNGVYSGALKFIQNHFYKLGITYTVSETCEIPSIIQSFRFPLLIVVCYLLLPNGGLLETGEPSFWLYLPITVILGNMIPLWMLQKGIELSSVLSINIILNVSPCVTFALELLDPSLNYSHSKLCVLVMLFLVMLMANDNVINCITARLRWLQRSQLS